MSSNVPTSRHHGAPKHGDALLAGLLRCRRCGRKLTLRYSGAKHSRYSCSRGWMDNGEPHCIAFGSLRVDDAIEDALLTVVGPGAIAAAVAAEKEANERRDLSSNGELLGLLKLAQCTRRPQSEASVFRPGIITLLEQGSLWISPDLISSLSPDLSGNGELLDFLELPQCIFCLRSEGAVYRPGIIAVSEQVSLDLTNLILT